MTSKCLKNFDYSEGAFPKTCWAGELMRNWGVPQKIGDKVWNQAFRGVCKMTLIYLVPDLVWHG